MTLSEEARQRLEDIVELQPTKNGELGDRWGLDSGSEVHRYLESELGEYYYRDDDSLICATPEAIELVGGDASDSRTVRGTALERAVLDALPGPDESPQSVVATLHTVEEMGEDASVDDVRSALHTLSDKGLVKRRQKTVPTFHLAVARDEITIETDED